MQKSSAVTEDIQIARDKALVSWDIKFVDSEAGTIKPQVMVTFSHERAPTQMGEKQGEHASAHALGVMITMQILRDFLPLEISNYSGITRLTKEMQLVKNTDDSLLKSFFDFQGSRSELLNGLSEEVKLQQELANANLDALRKVINVAILPPNSLVASTKDAAVVLEELAGTNIKLLDGQKLAIRRDYCMRVSTLAATMLLEYLNKAPFATFERIKAKDKETEDYEKAEGARVRKALAYLQSYATMPVELVVNLQVAEADTENLRKMRRPTRTTVATRRLAEEQEKIVEAMCDLLHYPQVEDAYSIAAIKEHVATKRTNELKAFSFVLARHIAMIFVTFNGLDSRADKQNIIDAFIERKIGTWDLDSKMCGSMMVNINSALTTWEQEKLAVRQAMQEEQAIEQDPNQSTLSLEPSPVKRQNLEAMAEGNAANNLLFSAASTLSSQQRQALVQQSSQQQEEDELSQEFPPAKLKG